MATPRSDATKTSSIPNVCDHPDAVYTVPYKIAQAIEEELTTAREALALVKSKMDAATEALSRQVTALQVDLAMAQSQVDAYKRQGTWTPLGAKFPPNRVPVLLAWIKGDTVRVREGYFTSVPKILFMQPHGKAFETQPTHWRQMPQPIIL